MSTITIASRRTDVTAGGEFGMYLEAEPACGPQA